jgi:hypothetical protein
VNNIQLIIVSQCFVFMSKFNEMVNGLITYMPEFSIDALMKGVLLFSGSLGVDAFLLSTAQYLLSINVLHFIINLKRYYIETLKKGLFLFNMMSKIN